MYDESVMNVIYEAIGIHTDDDILEEGKLNRVFMGFKIHPHQKLEVTLKKHEYHGYINLIKKQKDIEDLNYIGRDISTSINTIKKIMEKIKNGTDTKYSDKGITVKDCEATIKYFKTVARKAISDRKKN